MIVHLYDPRVQRGCAVMKTRLPFESACLSNIMEDDRGQVVLIAEGGDADYPRSCVSIDYRPSEIVCLRLALRNAIITARKTLLALALTASFCNALAGRRSTRPNYEATCIFKCSNDSLPRRQSLPDVRGGALAYRPLSLFDRSNRSTAAR